MGKKIVYVVGGAYIPNGMSAVLCQKINYLAEHTDYEVSMILTERPDLPFYYKFSDKVKWVNFDIGFDELDTMPLLRKLFSYLPKQRKYRRLFTAYLMEQRPDITVSTVRREINFITRIPDGSRKVGEIHFDRTFYRQFRKRYLPAAVNRLVSRWWMRGLLDNLKRLDRFVVLTHEDYQHWPELDNKLVIPNPLGRFPDRTSDGSARRVVAAGRYSWQKGFDLLIEAWQHVDRRHPDWELHIYGAGDHEAYQAQADGLGLQGRVVCHPATPDIYEAYRQSSIFVLSSRYEGFGLVLVEAMATGLPAVAFSCPCGPSDIVSHGEDGLLVENGNVQALADGIGRLIDDEPLRRQMGVRARENMKRYDEQHIMGQWLDLFGSL